MGDHPEPKLYDRSGVFNPITGQKSKGPKQRAEFSDLQVKAKADREAKELRARLSATHPGGLAEVRDSVGNVVKPAKRML